MDCKFKYSVEMLRTIENILVWVQEFRFYYIKIDALEDNNKRRNFKFIDKAI